MPDNETCNHVLPPRTAHHDEMDAALLGEGDEALLAGDDDLRTFPQLMAAARKLFPNSHSRNRSRSRDGAKGDC